MELIKEYLPFIIPLLLIQLTLMITGLIHILKHNQFKFGNKVIWIFVVALISIIGPILYFTIGRSDD